MFYYAAARHGHNVSLGSGRKEEEEEEVVVVIVAMVVVVVIVLGVHPRLGDNHPGLAHSGFACASRMLVPPLVC